ncbi:hypothetical protein GGR54DRAFT_640286 [Hypoxylon sp. NC1633]|nr:hypothetical protein GGR54DRAFT_640286 [Hypoxylon sp. NC1633]
MCTCPEWDYHCKQCNTVVFKDRSVPGHTCRAARYNGRRGVCRTGVEITVYHKVAAESCLPCEIRDEVDALTAETCDEAAAETCVGYTDVVINKAIYRGR